MYVLVLFLYAGLFSDSDAVTATQVYGFKSAASCQAAGQKSESLVSGTKKEMKFVCLKAE